MFKKLRAHRREQRSVWSVRSVCQKYSCHSRNSCSKKFMVTSVFKNLVFKTSCESIEIHHWSIPHCGQPQQFNIQHSKVKIALRASVFKKYLCHSHYSCSKKYRVTSVFKNLVFPMWAHCLITNSFFQKTFGSITEKAYLCIYGLIIRRLDYGHRRKKGRFYASFQGF